MSDYKLSVERLVGSESLRSDVSGSRDLTSVRVVLDSDVSSRTSTGLIIRGIITCILVLTFLLVVCIETAQLRHIDHLSIQV